MSKEEKKSEWNQDDRRDLSDMTEEEIKDFNEKLIEVFSKEWSFKLREETGAGVMDCKKALVRFDYDYDKALGWLKLGGHLKNTI